MGKAYIRLPFQSMFWCSPWWYMPQPARYMEQKLPAFRLHLVLAFQDSNLKSHRHLWIWRQRYKQRSHWRATEGEAEPWLRERSRHDLARWLFWPEIIERCFCQQATTCCIFKCSMLSVLDHFLLGDCSSYSQVAFLILKMQLEDFDASRSYAQVPFPRCNLIFQD